MATTHPHRARRRPTLPPSPAALVAAGLVLLAGAAAAQAGDPPTTQIVITGRAAAEIGGFGGQAPLDTPMQLRRIDADALADAGLGSLAGLTRLDASASDAYNTEGYWSYLSVRGFVLDNRSNYRRDGLPINAETALALDNKRSVELLRGTSGIQAGVSAPGGLVNLVVKRPTARVRALTLGWRQDGTVELAADWAERFGDAGQFGLRINAAAAELDPRVRDTEGRRQLLAVAGDWHPTPDSLLEAEFEVSRQRQPSVPGFSLRGDTLPDADTIDPTLSLNNQPWSLPVVLDGDTASLRWRQRLGADWQLVAHAATQRLRSDDRVAFPFGCYDAATDVYYADRYCPDGTFDLYDFRSENERRRTDALDLHAEGSARTGAWTHQLAAGVLLTRREDRFQRQAFNYAGTGRDDGSLVTDPAPELTDENTNRDERGTELYLRDSVQLSPAWAAWAGLRHSRLHRESVRTDGSRPTAYDQSFTTPWLGLVYRWSPATRLYASWGEGVETDVAPNRSRYVNAGQALPALTSRQWEAGVKHEAGGLGWGLAAFDITRPLAADIGRCDVDASCERRIDGEARHRGLEASVQWAGGPWRAGGSAMWLHARRQGAADPAANGLRPTNVPERSLRAELGYRVAGWHGAELSAGLVHEGPRMVLPDNSIEAPGWTRVDLGARWEQAWGDTRWTWRAGVDNLTDERAWRDTPYQFGHAYLFPLQPRTWRLSATVAF